MVVQSTGINSLPNELLLLILKPYSTRALLPLASVSHRFYDIILRIVHQRLLAAATLQDHHLILECFQPSAKLSTPGLHCDYLSTDDFRESDQSNSNYYDKSIGGLGELFGLYSHFRPRDFEEEPRPRRSHPAGDVPQQDVLNALEASQDKAEMPSQTINLESYELFTQLCTIINLVKVGPKRGLFVSCVTVAEGVIRVWRNWLAEHAVQPESSHPFSSIAQDTPLTNGSERTLWLDNAKTVGVKLRVIERPDLGSTPVLLGQDEDAPVTYTLEYEELVIKTSQLLLNVEESLQQEANHSGKALVINWQT